MSKTPAEGLRGDINNLSPRIGTYLISFANNPSLNNGVHPNLQLSESVFSTVDGLGADAFFNYLSDDEKKKFVENLQANKEEYTKHLSSEKDLNKFNYQIAKVEAAINGFSLAPSKLDDLDPSERIALKQALEKAIVHCSGKSPSGYAEAVIAETTRLLEEQGNIDPGALKRMQDCVAKGKMKKSPLVLDDEEKTAVFNATTQAAKKITDLFSNPSRAFDFANEQLKNKIINSSKLASEEEKKKLGAMLDTVKDLWKLGGDNLYGKKIAYLNNPTGLSNATGAEDAFAHIGLYLYNSSSPEQINKLSPVNQVVARYEILRAAMQSVGKQREYQGGNQVMVTLLPHLAKIDPAELEKNKEAITKLCAKAISDNTKRSGFLGLFGNEMVIKNGGLDKMGKALESSLSKFLPKPPKAAAPTEPTFRDATMLPPQFPPTVNKSKAYADGATEVNTPVQPIHIAPESPLPPRKYAIDPRDESSQHLVSAQGSPKKLTPKPPTTAPPTRPTSDKKKPAPYMVVNQKSFERWEAAELHPAGMPPKEVEINASKQPVASSDKPANTATTKIPTPLAPSDRPQYPPKGPPPKVLPPSRALLEKPLEKPKSVDKTERKYKVAPKAIPLTPDKSQTSWASSAKKGSGGKGNMPSH